ncbi:hypothetical protein DFH06DRAFT_1190026 [Mycena polygramma]|nr:hypothetical protein DFH06DRAFT_1190026 [Mycena polygramma]
MSTSPSTSSSIFTVFARMPRPGSADAPSFDGTNLTAFLDVLLRHGEHAGLSTDNLASLIVAYCTPEVARVIRHVPELQRDAKNWDAAVAELRELYSSDDTLLTHTVAELEEFCGLSCRCLPFRSISDAELYLRRFTQISGYLRELGFLTAAEVQIYLVAGLPFATRKAVEARLPEANRGTDSPPTKRQVMEVLRAILRRDSFETFVTTRLLPKHSSSSLSPSDPRHISTLQSRLQSEFESKPRSHRCFVCGRTGAHRLGPRFCPRTRELLREGLVLFDANGRLVSHDGSPLPMTRNPGGVAAHLFSSSVRRRCTQNIPQPSSSILHSTDIAERAVRSSQNPPQPPIAPRRPPSPIFPPIVAAIPSNVSPPPPRFIPSPPQPMAAPRRPPSPILPPPNVEYSPDALPCPPRSIFHSPHTTPLSHPSPPSRVHPSPSVSIKAPLSSSSPKPSVCVDDPKWLAKPVTLPFADILAFSPTVRHKLAEYIRDLDSLAIRDSSPPPSIVSQLPGFISRFVANFLSVHSLILVLITWSLSRHFLSPSKHLGLYDYLADMIAFFLSYVTRSLLDYILI